LEAAAHDAGTDQSVRLGRVHRRHALGRLRVALAIAVVALGVLAGTRGTQDAVANGDTRTLSLFADNTKETLTVTFKRNGSFDSEGLRQLNWLLRDWRLDEPTKMDPRLFDLVWEVYREAGAREPIHVLSGYRSPQTNAALRQRSRVVAEHSQHMLGKAMDFYLPDVDMARVREIGMRLQDGGVGFYPNAYNVFVHLDVGSVRAWPRMTHAQLARLFPDGKTVHVPRDGKPFPGYEEAKAEILARGGSVAGYTTYAEAEEGGGRKSLWAMLFGGDDDDDSAFYNQQRQARTAGRAPSNASSYASAESNDGGGRGLFSFLQPQAPQPAPAPEPQAPAAGRRGTAVAARSEPEPVAPDATAADTLLQPPEAPAGAETAAAAVEVLAAIPVPPPRPDAIEPLIAEAPLPPVRPVALAALQGGAPVVGNDLKGQMRLPAARPPRAAAPAADDKASLRALFATAATPVSGGTAPDPGRFSGPAIAPAQRR
jgi:uncharacterized protein YcbK (DUF882 family)